MMYKKLLLSTLLLAAFAAATQAEINWQDADPVSAATDSHGFFTVESGNADPAGGGATVGRVYYPDPTHPPYRSLGINGDNNGFGTAGSGTYVSTPLGGAYQYATVDSGYRGNAFAYSLDVYLPAASPLGDDVDDTISIFVRWQDSAGATVTISPAAEVNLASHDTWQTLSLSGTSPTDASVVRAAPIFSTRDANTNAAQNTTLFYMRNIDFQLSGTNSPPPPPPPGGGIFEETGGMVVMEAEHVELVDDWVVRPVTPVSDSTMVGSLGDGWLEWTGDQYSGNTISEGAAHAILTYTFEIATAGDYIFRWRSKQYNQGAGDAGNDTFVRFNSGTTPSGYQDFSDFTKVWVQSKTDWSWNTTFEPVHGTHYGSGNARRTYAPGTHSIQLAARSPDHSIDRIVLHRTSVPFDAGNFESAPESPITGGPPYVYMATNFPAPWNTGEVPYYEDEARHCLAINAANESYRGKFARASIDFDGIAGTYDVAITALQELDGECTYRLLVNGVQVGSAVNDPTGTDYSEQDHVFYSVVIPEGATLSVESNTDSNGLIPENGGFAWARGRWRTLTITTPSGGPFGPAVDAGPDQIVLLPGDSAVLTGSATDDGVVTSTVWTQQSGPAATLSGTNTPTLSVSGLVEGTYVFRLTATDDEALTGYDEASVYVVPEGSGLATVTGELKKWHKVTFSWDGPSTSETASPNPFADYRLDVTFMHAGSGKSYVVPGYFAADGNAAETSADAGAVWRAHFAPDEAGLWSYAASFRTGTDVAVAASPGSGSSAGYFDGDAGTFTVVPTDKTGRDFRGKGRLQYVDKHHLQFAETGEYFLKAGADAPENFLAYDDFDDTPNTGGRRKSWSPHAGDYDAGDAGEFTWQRGEGTAMLGAVKYLADKGMNAFSFLTFNVDGDDDNAFPHRLKGTVSAYESVSDNQRWNNGSGPYHDRFDVSKMDQWEHIFEYADKKGMYLHFKTQETENDQKMDGGGVGRERKLYYRELIARYSHHLALNWNCGEENTQTTTQRKDMAQYFYDTDPYRHNVVLHTYPGDKDNVYPALLGSASKYTGASLQSNPSSVFSDTRKWRNDSAAAGKPWVVANDEQGSANIGIDCDSADSSHNDHRKNVLWGNLMAGGAGVEAYFGYQTCSTDLNCEDYRTRDNWWNLCAHALDFFVVNQVPFWNMSNQDGLVSTGHCLAGDNTFVVYLPNGGTANLNLSGVSGAFVVRWFDPRNGGGLQIGSVATVAGGGTVGLGTAPSSTGSDWAVLVSGGVPGQNFPPSVDAGPDQAQVLEDRNPVAVILDGAVSDDELPEDGILTSRWSVVSSPSSISFGDADELRTIATFYSAGTYVLRLTAGDGELTSYDEVTITLGSTVPGQEVPFSPTDDAYLQGSGETLFNTADLRVESGNRVSYLKFTVSGSSGAAAAGLRLTEGSDTGNGTIHVYAGSHNNWTETTLSAATKPAQSGGALDTFSGTVSDGMEVTWDVGSFVTGDGTYSFIVEHASGNDVAFASKEASPASAHPALVLSLPNTPPTCTITAPTNGASALQTYPVAVQATASDAEGAVSTMELFVNGISAGTRAGETGGWSVSGLQPGSHELVVVATDAMGTVASDSVLYEAIASEFETALYPTAGGLSLEWASVPGLYYQVYYADALPEAAWLPLDGAVQAMDPTMMLAIDPTLVPQRFYRIEESAGR